MEDFEKLLEEYLNFEEFEVEEEENLEQSKSAGSRKESPFTVDDAISIDRFVNAFLGYQMNCSTLYHSGLRQLELDYVIGVDNGFANKNIEYVKRGFLLIVIDARGKRGTYINPVYIQKYLNKEDIEKTYKSFRRAQQIELAKIKTYYNKYLEAQMSYNELERFERLIKETHKESKIKVIEKREKHD